VCFPKNHAIFFLPCGRGLTCNFIDWWKDISKYGFQESTGEDGGDLTLPLFLARLSVRITSRLSKSITLTPLRLLRRQREEASENYNYNYSQTCVQRFRGHLCCKSPIWDLKIVVVIGRWPANCYSEVIVSWGLTVLKKSKCTFALTSF